MFYTRVEIKKSNKNKNMYEKQKGIKFNALVICTFLLRQRSHPKRKLHYTSQVPCSKRALKSFIKITLKRIRLREKLNSMKFHKHTAMRRICVQ